MKDVYFDFGCFATILSAVVESYPQETYGFIGGEDTEVESNDNIRVITFYPARRDRYEN